jgi:hypothetical protein
LEEEGEDGEKWREGEGEGELSKDARRDPEWGGACINPVIRNAVSVPECVPVGIIISAS